MGVKGYKAAIFDMDGVLIDSEPLWRCAEIEVFGSVGLELTEELCKQTMGYRIDEVVAYWYGQQPWQGKSRKTVENEILATLMALVETHGTAMAGIYRVLELLKRHRFKLGLATSSPHTLIASVVSKLGIEGYFQVCCSAMDETLGKPDSGVYLSALAGMGVESEDCIAFEDSVAGIRAARAAGIMTIAVPEAGRFQDQRFDEADLKLPSLEDFSLDILAI
jgi:sugar-phosphatase